MTLGGYVTEQMIFNDLSTGPSNDLQVVANTARDMVTKYGMSEKIGPVALEASSSRLISGEETRGSKHGAQVAKLVDEEVNRIIEEGKERAREVLEKHIDALHAISKKLAEVETLERDEYEAELKKHGIEIKDAFKAKYGEERSADASKVIAPDGQGNI